MIKIIGQKNKITPLINCCNLLGYSYTLDKTATAQGIFLYSNESTPLLPFTYCYLISENPIFKNNLNPNIFYTENINSPLFPSLFATHFSNQQKEAFKKVTLYKEEKTLPYFMIKENIVNFYYPQNKLILHTLSNEISSLSIAKYIADYYAKKQYKIHLYSSTTTSFQKKNIKIIPQINNLITIYTKKHLHIIDAKKPPLSSFFEDSKRLLLIHNNIDEIDWLKNNLGNLNHTALLFIKFTVLKKLS
ncbi:hypothetical protein AZF37_08420 [endosymbiont 'TC1' of Trimyema compressum]|uniref:hypothetical protein n=1 Tax=endosymbiont 'TC1' of Trimyema compressum TaxID=243899 RepID=UPI0007F11B3E|nr:hypothetical protein [endosymbiont 'TC1' of Trimyema compressum]AMP21179.1 hypothetical protein AZF37_08420 [endosymbiont 'TC1' of Trimyema compressum]